MKNLGRVALAGLVLLGIARSAVRHRDWRDNTTIWSRTLYQAPTSYKPYHALGEILYENGQRDEGIRFLNKALVLNPGAWGIEHELADMYAHTGRCAAALLWYAESLEIEPDQPVARASRVECLLELGREEDARREAHEALEFARLRDAAAAAADR